MKTKLLLFFLVVFLVTGFLKNRLPASVDIVDALYIEPEQVEVIADPVEIEKGGMVYTVQPLYAYELQGLIVSDHKTGGWFDYYHSQWKDTLNIKDVCVVWGDNLTDDNFRKMKYKNGSWTCYYSSPNREVWRRFNADALSNNHILVDDDHLAGLLMKAGRGDQIALKGYLSEYSHQEGFKRGTSISREDKRGGACETIYLTDFEILKRGNVFWAIVHAMVKGALILLCFWSVISFFLPPAVLKRMSFKK
ncbi:hypothetical protein ACFL49_03065 [Candidatus Omnitrophota bacterium]